MNNCCSFGTWIASGRSLNYILDDNKYTLVKSTKSSWLLAMCNLALLLTAQHTLHLTLSKDLLEFVVVVIGSLRCVKPKVFSSPSASSSTSLPPSCLLDGGEATKTALARPLRSRGHRRRWGSSSAPEETFSSLVSHQYNIWPCSPYEATTTAIYYSS